MHKDLTIDNISKYIIYILLIIYIYNIKPPISKSIEKIYKNVIFRILVLGLITYLCSNDLLLGIIISILYVTTSTCLFRKETSEAFDLLNEYIIFENFKSNI